jgi:membrane-associated phospholipid phosphatase
VNVYAAMPSMHVAWSVIVGQLLMRIFPERLWVRIAGWLHPVVMATAVVVTANHYLLDIIVGLLVLLVAILVGSKWARIPMLGRLPI